jgi:hypothetical protein
MSYTQRAIARLHNRAGQARWVCVSKETGKPVGLRISYPDELACQRFCGADEEPKRVTVVEAAGPFSDRVVSLHSSSDES